MPGLGNLLPMRIGFGEIPGRKTKCILKNRSHLHKATNESGIA